jgi:hypothetical protein
MMSDKKISPNPFAPALLEASADSALSAVASADARAAELVDAWVRSGNAGAVAAIADHGVGPARKAARRGLNVLRSRGVRVEAPPHVTTFAAADSGRETVTEAWLVPPDAGGNVLLVIASRSPTTRAESGFFYLHDSVGVHAASVGSLSGTGLKDALKRAAEAGCEPVHVPLDYARQRVAEGREQLKARAIPEPLGMTSAKQLLEPSPVGPVPHPLDAEGLELSDEDAKELASRSAGLHMLREFRAWLPERSAVDEMLNDIGEHLPKGSEQTAEIVQKVVKDAVEAATDRYFGPERRQILVRRMKDCALSVLSTEGEERALETVATMKRIEQAGLITDAPNEIPFLRGFFDKALATLAMQGGGRLQVPVKQGAEAAEAATNVA